MGIVEDESVIESYYYKLSDLQREYRIEMLRIWLVKSSFLEYEIRNLEEIAKNVSVADFSDLDAEYIYEKNHIEDRIDDFSVVFTIAFKRLSINDQNTILNLFENTKEVSYDECVKAVETFTSNIINCGYEGDIIKNNLLELIKSRQKVKSLSINKQ